MRHLTRIILWFLAFASGAWCQDIESGLAGVILYTEGTCATQTYIVEGPSFDPNNDGLAPATELRTTGSSAGKRLQSFLLPWTPCIAGASLRFSRALATDRGGGMYGVFENGVEFELGPETGLDNQTAFYPRRFQLRRGELWLATHRQIVTVKTSRTEVVAEAGSAFFLRSGAEKDELIVLRGDVAYQGECHKSHSAPPWYPHRNELENVGRGEFQDALQSLGESCETEFLFVRAALEHAMGRQKKALELYRVLLEKEPDHSPARIAIATAKARAGRTEEALSLLDRVNGPQRRQTRALKAHLLAQMGRRAEARSLIDEELSKAPSPFLERILKVAWARVTDRAEAVKTLREVQAQFPDDPFLANNLGVALAAGGRLKEGLGQLQKSKKMAPLVPIIRQNIGTLYLLTGQTSRAQSEFTLLSLYAPDSGVARQGLAFAYNGLGASSMGNRLLAQASALDPLLIAPGRGEIVLNGTYRNDRNPESFVNVTRRLDGVAVSLSNETGNATLSNENASSLEIGVPMGKGGNLAGLVSRRTTEFEVGATTEEPNALLLYENKLDRNTSLWLAGSFAGPLQETELPAALNRAKQQNYRFEARLDRRLSPRQGISAGASYRHGESLVQGPGLELTSERTTERVWAQNQQLLGSGAILTTGLGADRLRGSNSKINPYLGLLVTPDERTTVSLGVVRQSDIPLVSDPRLRGQAQLLEKPLISTTGLFPLRDQEIEFIRLNSPDLLPLPYWDYRLQARRAVNDEVYAILELHQTDVLPSDLAGQTSDPLLAGRPATGRSRLRGASLQADFQRKQTFANLVYRYRDYTDENGHRWILVPRHELQGQILLPLGSGLSAGIVPVYQSDLLTPLGETDVGSLSAFIRIPIDRGSLNLGYLNLLSTDRRIAEGSVLVNLILKF